MYHWWQSAFQSLQEEPGRAAPGWALRTGAAALSWLYGLGAGGRRLIYDRGWLKVKRLPCPVLSIGNLVAGGVGKTPVTAFMAERLRAAGCRVAIVCRGYGGQETASKVISDGNQVFLQPPQTGDEAYMLARKLKGVSVVTGVDRFQAGMLAWEAFHPDLMVLDDGFQHFQLHRDLDVVLLDAERPFGNGRLLPRGPLREPRDVLNRRLILLLTRYQADRHQRLWEELKTVFPQADVLRAVFRPAAAVRYPGAVALPLAELATWHLAAFAGLARPESFAASLQELGVHLHRYFIYPDHHVFSTKELASLIEAARRLKVQALITTEKDWARLAERWSASLPLIVVSLRVELLDPWPEALMPPGCAVDSFKFQAYKIIF